jgi:sodium/pantothenate symporter
MDVVTKFSVGAGVLVVVGLISAGLSTLESLIQSLSITITTDIIGTISPKIERKIIFNQ